jgi:hypothetical protein
VSRYPKGVLACACGSSYPNYWHAIHRSIRRRRRENKNKEEEEEEEER